jgi:hypothetical protein
MTEEDEAFEDLAKRQGDWGMQGSRKHQIMRYVEPSKRPWVGLTNQEQLDIFAQSVAKKRSEYEHYKAIEQALKEKNT